MRPGDLRVYATSVLSCGCGIRWLEHHRKMKVLMCHSHGAVLVVQIR